MRAERKIRSPPPHVRGLAVLWGCDRILLFLSPAISALFRGK